MMMRLDTYLLTYGAETFLKNRQLYSPSRTSQHFMEPEGSTPCSQDLSTGPYPEPYQSNPLHPILSLSNIVTCQILGEMSTPSRAGRSMQHAIRLIQPRRMFQRSRH
jgi:hypothetical protein